jgi:hypothetical protein
VRAEQALQAVLHQVVDVGRVRHPRRHHPADDRLDRQHILGRGGERGFFHVESASPPAGTGNADLPRAGVSITRNVGAGE